ncbi:MAG: hypothetical protein NCW75_01120 [Phycisphaera sp.]|nr:MAG: hypothetical protein NCW75_01120 [Phycisphaera sp.]
MATTTQSSDDRTAAPARHEWLAFFGRSGFGIALAVLLFTALIWLRLRLVTDVPRQAYAEPKPQERQVVTPDRRDRDAVPSGR